MKTVKQNIVFRLKGAALLSLVLFSFLFSSDLHDIWRTRENQVLRFGSQWEKIGMLNQELMEVSDVLSDIRDLQLFPSELTRIDNSTMISIDRKMEAAEKKCTALKTKVNALRPPLIDAMSILREMVVNEPVDGMFEVLERQDLERISEMIEVKNAIDSLWGGIDRLFGTLTVSMGIDEQKINQPSEKEEFVQILKASLGQRSETSYQKLNFIKNALVNRSNLAQAREMYLVENRRIREYLKDEKYEISRKKTLDLIKRYEGRVGLDELNLQLARVNFALGNYPAVITIASKITEGSKSAEKVFPYLLQSLYSLHKYNEVWASGKQSELLQQRGAAKNLLLWLVLESGIALQKKEDYSKRASAIEKGSPYAIHVLHAFARSFLVQNDTAMAFSVLESALKVKPVSDNDKKAFYEVKLTMAELFYESGAFENALAIFFPMLKEEVEIDRVLTGVAWCYFGMGADEKAENALRKLINQKPESPLAAEAIFTLAKRLLQKANTEWEKNVFLSSEEKRLSNFLERVKEAAAENPSERKFLQAASELELLLERIRGEKHPGYNDIASIYARVNKIINMLTTYYASGSFQEVRFTQKREQLLLVLDSLMIDVNEAESKHIVKVSRLETVTRNRDRIKAVVDEMNIFKIDVMLDRFKWEREYLDWQKGQLHLKVDSSTASALDSILKREESIKRQAYKDLTARIKTALQSEMKIEDQAYLRYHLAELHYSEENDNYSREVDNYEANLEIYNDLISKQDTGLVKRIAAPALPVLSHGKSLSEFRKVIKLQSDSQVTAAALYSMGWCFNDLSQFDSAFHYMRTVAVDYPASSHAAQAWMYCGEYHFDKSELDEAIKCYHSVLKYPESDYFDQALYKLAWTQYRLSNPEKAISSFLALVELGDGTKAGALLEKESMDYIAISFSETDISGDQGLQKAVTFVNKFGDPEKGYRILERLAGVYRDQGRYDMASKTYKTILKMYPQHPQNPLLESQLLAISERGKSPDESGRMKLAFFNKYNKKSSWSKAQKDSVICARADSLASKHLYDAAIGFHQFALQNNDTTLFDYALEAYQEFVDNYPNAPITSECHYNMAEVQFSMGDFRQAAKEYINVSRLYKNSKYRETAAWNAIVASQQLLKVEEGAK